MYLTEEQIHQREELFLALIEDITAEHYDVTEDHIASEEELYVTSIIMEYFVEEYKKLSINESALFSTYGIDPNIDLYFELEEILLDESIGSMVAGAVHGMGGLVAKVGKKMAQSKAATAKAKASAAKAKATAAAKTASQTAKNKSGLIGSIKAGFHKAKAEKLAGQAEKAKLAASKAATDRDAAANKSKAVQTRRARLASKIDTGLSNIKNKVSSAVRSGAERMGAVAGRLAAR